MLRHQFTSHSIESKRTIKGKKEQKLKGKIIVIPSLVIKNRNLYLHSFLQHILEKGGQIDFKTLAAKDLVAQLVEHLPFKERVLGSSPSQVTKERKSHPIGWLFCFPELS